MMADQPRRGDIRVETGRCRTHGVVQATRAVPRIRFPFIVFGAMRLIANMRPYRCPVCGAPVERA